LNVVELDPLADVDSPEDLPLYENVVNRFLSIVIPTLNEETEITETLKHVGAPDFSEVIVADGGSRDRTVALARKWGAQVVSSPAGRGLQLNRGAEQAQGDILLFLHADTRLPPGYASLIREALDDPCILGGYFSLLFFPSTRRLRIKAWMISLRTRCFGLAYGDQAYFVRASVFRHLTGFPEIPLMEDLEFIRKLRRLGQLAFIRSPVSTSARRFLRHGQLWATLQNKVTYFAYFLGVSPERLEKFYYRKNPQVQKDRGAKTD
jgi:rSAM/selenodomain-associated transferase 2